MKEKSYFNILFLPHKLRARAEYGANLHGVIHSMNADGSLKSGYKSPCGGNGTCGKCRIRIVSGAVSSPDPREEQFLTSEDLAAGIRLACYVRIEGDVTVSEVDEHREMSVETEFKVDERIIPDGRFVESLHVTCSVPVPDDNRDISERTAASVTEKYPLKSRDFQPDMLNSLAGVNRKLLETKEPADIWVHVCEGEISGISPYCEPDVFYGIAVDIGTTTIACYLVDLETGRIIDVESELNSQHTAGADVIARISYTINNDRGSDELAGLIHGQIQNMIITLCNACQVLTEKIVSCSIAGNTTMMHMLLGVDARTVSRFPFNPVFTGSKNLRSFFPELKNCTVYLLPSASAYIGADIVGGVAAINMDSYSENGLFIDIGTNGEIVLKAESQLHACSTAAGPAFEGANLSCGVGGVTGAVDSVEYDGAELVCKTINEAAPVGICGSGVIDVTAILLSEGLIDEKGRFADIDHPLAERVIIINGKKAFSLFENAVFVTQSDIREIQLAKSAIFTGLESLLEEAGIGMDDISRLFIGGGFGSRIRIRSASIIGLVPGELEDRIVFVGNSSGRGAAAALLNRSFRERCDRIREEMKIVDLSGRESFTKDLMKNMYFKVNRICKEVKRVEQVYR